MTVWETITGSDLTRDWKLIQARAEALPADYQEAWGQIKIRLFRYAGFTGRNLMPLFDGVVGLLEETAADGQDIHQVLGDDIDAFCSDLAGGEGSQSRSYRDRWRRQLNQNVARKLGRLGG